MEITMEYSEDKLVRKYQDYTLVGTDNITLYKISKITNVNKYLYVFEVSNTLNDEKTKYHISKFDATIVFDICSFAKMVNASAEYGVIVNDNNLYLCKDSASSVKVLNNLLSYYSGLEDFNFLPMTDTHLKPKKYDVVLSTSIYFHKMSVNIDIYKL